MTYRQQQLKELDECIVSSVAITCSGCGAMIQGLTGVGLATLAYNDGWRYHEDEALCHTCYSSLTYDPYDEN